MLYGHDGKIITMFHFDSWIAICKGHVLLQFIVTLRLKLYIEYFFNVVIRNSSICHVTVIPRFTVLLGGKQKCMVNRGHGKLGEITHVLL